MSPAAACLSSTLFAQLALAVALPGVLLWMAERGRDGRSSSAWMDRFLGEQPGLVAVWSLEFVWVFLRTAVAHALPAD